MSPVLLSTCPAIPRLVLDQQAPEEERKLDFLPFCLIQPLLSVGITNRQPIVWLIRQIPRGKLIRWVKQTMQSWTACRHKPGRTTAHPGAGSRRKYFLLRKKGKVPKLCNSIGKKP